ncbi:MAG: hypothetical protein J3K34DRAFT_517950, partial [Monoraphidium minutum]
GTTGPGTVGRAPGAQRRPVAGPRAPLAAAVGPSAAGARPPQHPAPGRTRLSTPHRRPITSSSFPEAPDSGVPHRRTTFPLTPPLNHTLQPASAPLSASPPCAPRRCGPSRAPLSATPRSAPTARPPRAPSSGGRRSTRTWAPW